MKQWEELINQVDVFSGLGAKEREALLVGAQEREYRRRRPVLGAHSSANQLLVVTRGALKTIREDQPNQRLILEFLGPGDLIGEESVLMSGDSEFAAMTVENSSVLAIPADNVRRLLDTSPRFCRALAALAMARARAFRERLYFLTAAPVQVRLAALLHQLARRFGKRDRKGTLIALRVTHQDLADYIGASRETVTIFLAGLKAKGIIITNVRKIIIPDLKNLKKFSQLK